MKKFWEKHDLLKVSGIVIIITVIMTWIIKQGNWNGTELAVGEITRVGIFDFFTYGLLGMFYFTILVTFIFVVGGFYQVLSKTSSYQNLTNYIAKKSKGKEILFVLIVSFIIAALSAVLNEYYIILAFIPFILSIMSKMKLDKITGFVTTFGSILIGFIGSIYSTKIAGINNGIFSLEYNDFIWFKLCLFGISYILFNTFTVLHLKKKLKSKKDEALNELFDGENVTKKSKGKTWPMAVIFGLFVLISILAYMPWVEAFNVTIFNDITKSIKEYELLGAPVFGYLLGNVEAFGNWDLFGIQILMLITALIVKWTYKINLSDFFTSFGEGFAKVGKLVVVLLAAFLILEFAVMFPVLPTVVDWIMNLSSSFNVFLGTISGLFTSLFTTEYQYTANLIGSYLSGTYADIAKQISIMMQSTFGIAALIAPSSAILLVGLSYLEISYKDWFKYIWKFLVAMIVISIILMFIII
ncbi:MAG: hypothetical protein PHP49_02130 [Bacilli bacterium]|nr:hypothetical protein [Bacilli bacterium]